MRQQFSIAGPLIAAGLALLVVLSGAAAAQDVKLAPNAPERYVVKSGDTLWAISGRFLKDPWRWPDVWRMNREQIKNPHWIYPGDVVVLDMVDGKPRLSLERGGRVVSAATPQPQREAAGPREPARLSPRIRSTPIDPQAIASIPAGDIDPFLSRPLITGIDGLPNSAEVVAGRDQRVIRGDGDFLYAAGIERNAGDAWYIYRPGRTFTSFENPDDILGYEQRYIGSAKVERFGDISTIIITKANEEVIVGDRLVPAPRGQLINYAPHAPARPVGGHIIALDQESNEAGVGWIVTIDKGAQDGIDVGSVLATFKTFPPIADPRPSKEPDRVFRFTERTIFFQPDRWLDLPDERTGLLFVYKVFDRVSYALLVRTADPIEVGNYVRNP